MQEFVMEEALGGGTILCESVGEYTLPDYMPEVRRVLRVDASACIAGQYENGDRTDIGGDTHYTLLYTDAEGKLAVAELDGTFESVVSLPQGTPLMIYPRVENTSCRLGGPRKVSLRAGISLHPYASARVTVLPPAVDEAAGQIETLCRPVPISETVYFHASDLALTDSIKCESGTVVLTTDAKGLVREVKCEEGCVRVRGEVWMTALCTSPDGEPSTLSCKIPFEEIVSCDGVTPDFTGIARLCCRRISCETAEGTGTGSMLFDVTFVLDGMAAQCTTADVVVDLFSTSYEMRPKCETVTSRYYPVLQMANFTVDGTVAGENFGADREVLRPLDARGTVGSVTCTADGGIAVVEGDLRVSCVLACDASDGSYRCENFTIPYKVRVNCGETIPYGTTLQAEVCCISCRARADGARLGVDAELGVMLIGVGCEEVDVVRSATPDPDSPVSRADHEIISAYLTSGDTLWSIAKRYHTPLAGIVAANSLPDEVMESPDFPQGLDGLTRLMIL